MPRSPWCAARARGVPCEVFVPEVSSPAKRAVLAALGARVQVSGAAYPEALAACLARQAESGALLMHAYDQAEIVARAVARVAGIPVRRLLRRHPGPSQTGRARLDRLTGVGFSALGPVAGTVVVCDDVLTTGATLSAAAEALRRAGAAYVVSLVVARTPPG